MREMKDSGIEWIGEIPKEWQVRKIKHIRNSEVNSFVDGDWIESPFITDEGICYLTTGNIGDGFYKKQGNSFITLETFIKLNCKYAYPNDLIISRLNAPYGRSCILTEDYTEYVIAVDNVILRTDENKKFLCYVTQCKNYQISVLDKSAGTTMKRISRTNLGNIFIPLPPRSEQNAIASYLDKKCSNIDAIITKNEQIIEKLKEYKSSLITKTVTKGLNPDAEMKDSGVEWIGEIPAEWKIVKVKYTGYFENGLTYSPNDITDETGILVLRSSNIQSGNLDFNDCIYVFSAPEDLMVKRGDIIICSRNGSVNLVGKSVYIDNDIVATFGAFMMRYRTKIFDKFAFYMLQHVISYYKSFFATSTINQLTIKTIRQMVVALPSKSEQTAIANYLDEKCSIIDANIKKREIIIEKLAEYKKSLIYEVVTGKKEII